jgi:hypothetical protein
MSYIYCKTVDIVAVKCRSQWPCGLRRGSAAAHMLGLWVRIPRWAMDVCLLQVLCVVRYRSLRRADHSSRGVLTTVVRDLETWRMRRTWPVLGLRATGAGKKYRWTGGLRRCNLTGIVCVVKAGTRIPFTYEQWPHWRHFATLKHLSLRFYAHFEVVICLLRGCSWSSLLGLCFMSVG